MTLYRVHYRTTNGSTGSTALDRHGTFNPVGVSKEEAEWWANYWNRVTTAGTEHWIEITLDDTEFAVTA